MLLISEARQGANFLYFCYATAATLLCGGGIENLAGANFVENSTFQTKCEVERATLYSRNNLFPSFSDLFNISLKTQNRQYFLKLRRSLWERKHSKKC